MYAQAESPSAAERAATPPSEVSQETFLDNQALISL